MGFVAEVPVAGVILGELTHLRLRQIRLVHRFGRFADFFLVQERAGDAGQGRIHQQPFAGELMDGHAMIGGVMADEFQLLQAVDFPGLIAEFAVIVCGDVRVDA